MSEEFIRFWPKNFKKFSKLPSTCPEEQFVAWIFFYFWTVLDFLQKPLAWFSNFYLRFQSKNSWRNNFFNLLFRVSSDFERKIFQTSGRKTLRSFQNYFLRVQRNSLWLDFFFFKFWIVLDFLQKPLAWFSKFYLRVQSKNCGGNGFFCFSFSDFFFRILSGNFSDFWPKNFKKLSKLPSACADEQFLAWRNFQKFWTVLVFLEKPLAWFSEFYLRVQGKISGRNSFLNFPFQNFFQFRAKYFQTFGQKNFKKLSKLPSACSDEQFLAWIFFSKVLNCFGFSAETFGMVLKHLFSCPEWKFRKK